MKRRSPDKRKRIRDLTKRKREIANVEVGHKRDGGKWSREQEKNGEYSWIMHVGVLLCIMYAYYVARRTSLNLILLSLLCELWNNVLNDAPANSACCKFSLRLPSKYGLLARARTHTGRRSGGWVRRRNAQGRRRKNREETERSEVPNPSLSETRIARPSLSVLNVRAHRDVSDFHGLSFSS